MRPEETAPPAKRAPAAAAKRQPATVKRAPAAAKRGASASKRASGAAKRPPTARARARVKDAQAEGEDRLALFMGLVEVAAQEQAGPPAPVSGASRSKAVRGKAAGARANTGRAKGSPKSTAASTPATLPPTAGEGDDGEEMEAAAAGAAGNDGAPAPTSGASRSKVALRTGRGGRGWKPEEEATLQEQVRLHGQKSWSLISRSLPGRTGKQCRERYLNHLRPDIKRQSWTSEEELVLAEGHARLGTRWSSLVHLLPGRTENQIKNHWNATLRCKGRLRAGTRMGPEGSLRNGVLREYHAALAEGQTRGSALGLAASVLLAENKVNLVGGLPSASVPAGPAVFPLGEKEEKEEEEGAVLRSPGAHIETGKVSSPESTKTDEVQERDNVSEGSTPRKHEDKSIPGKAAAAGRNDNASAVQVPSQPTSPPPVPEEGRAVVLPIGEPAGLKTAPLKTVGTAGEKVEPSGDDMTATRVSAPPHTLDASEPSPAHRVERSCLASTEPLSVQAGPSGEDRIHVFLRPITPGDLSEFTKHAQTLGGGHIASYTGLSTGEDLLPANPTSISAIENACVSLCCSARARWDPASIVVAVCAGKYADGEVCSTVMVAAKSSHCAFECLSHIASVYRDALRGALQNSVS